MRANKDIEVIVKKCIGAAIEVHRHLGPGLLESVYETCLEKELKLMGLGTVRQLAVPVFYKGERLESAFCIDLLVEDSVVLEIKAVEKAHPIHKAQLITYLKLADKETGLLINFNTVLLKDGLTRLYKDARDS